MTSPLDELRQRVGAAVFTAVAGSGGGDQRSRIIETPGRRWFEDSSPITTIHADSAMFVGGLRALLLQSLHPLAMAGVAQHSDYRTDPWGRLARTSYFLAATTYGPAEIADGAVAAVRAVHERVHGVAADGRSYSASDPHLLRWVHIAEVDSFLRSHRRYGRAPLEDAGYDRYVEQMATIGSALGAIDLPTSRQELDDAIESYRPELRGTPDARRAARFLILQPPMPVVARRPYLALAAAATAMLPWWARWPLRLPWLPLTEAIAVTAIGDAVTRTIRWATTPPSPSVLS